MKSYSLERRAICTCLFLISGCLYACAQSGASKQNLYNCNQYPLGLFRQITGSTIKLSATYNDSLVFTKDSDFREGRWTLDALDEVDPAYQFYLIRNPSVSDEGKCGPVLNVVGKLISPTGKLFDFKRATYDIATGKLEFITLERDGISYEVEALFYTESKFVKGMFEKGTMKLKALGDSLGVVEMEFRFKKS